MKTNASVRLMSVCLDSQTWFDLQLSAEELSKLLLHEAQERGSKDNISVIVVLFEWISPERLEKPSGKDLERVQSARSLESYLDYDGTHVAPLNKSNDQYGPDIGLVMISSPEVVAKRGSRSSGNREKLEKAASVPAIPLNNERASRSISTEEAESASTLPAEPKQEEVLIPQECEFTHVPQTVEHPCDPNNEAPLE
jgi:hypothetical protein